MKDYHEFSLLVKASLWFLAGIGMLGAIYSLIMIVLYNLVINGVI